MKDSILFSHTKSEYRVHQQATSKKETRSYLVILRPNKGRINKRPVRKRLVLI